MQMKLEEFQSVVQTNLVSAFLCTRAALRQCCVHAGAYRQCDLHLRAHGPGRAGQLCCLQGWTHCPHEVHCARSCQPQHHRQRDCAGIYPTELTSTVSQEFKDYYLNISPLKRFGTPEEVAAAISFLCLPEAGYITGQTIAVDGGISMQ